MRASRLLLLPALLIAVPAVAHGVPRYTIEDFMASTASAFGAEGGR